MFVRAAEVREEEVVVEVVVVVVMGCCGWKVGEVNM